MPPARSPNAEAQTFLKDKADSAQGAGARSPSGQDQRATTASPPRPHHWCKLRSSPSGN